MGKYSTSQEAVYSLFASIEWEAEGISAFPVGFSGDKVAPPYIRLSLIPSEASINTVLTGGVLMIEIFTAWGEGPNSATEIADKLDGHLEKKTLGGVQFQTSTLSGFERDRDAIDLGRAIYSIPYTLFGV